jgi:hypothetical protein
MEVATRDVHVDEAVQNLWWFSEEGQKRMQEDDDLRTELMNRDAYGLDATRRLFDRPSVSLCEILG